jgi:hypothetical protein
VAILNQEQQQILLQLLAEFPDWTDKTIADALEQKCGVVYHPRNICQQRNKLNQFKKQARTVYSADEQSAFYLYWQESQLSLRQASKNLGISEGVLNRIVVKHGQTTPFKKLLNQEQQQLLKQLLAEFPIARAGKIINLFRYQTGISINSRIVHYYRYQGDKRVNLSKKQQLFLKSLLAAKAKPKEIKRQFYRETGIKISTDTIYYYQNKK